MKLSSGLVEEVVAFAGRAPSLQNSQPWQFRLRNDALEISVATDRVLAITDPRARELVISCGAAILTAELALRRCALEPITLLSPDPFDPLLLARIEVEQGGPPTSEELRLLAAVVHRHTHRFGFLPAPLAAGLVTDLEDGASSEGSDLVWVTEPGTVRTVVRLAQSGERRRVHEPDRRAELAAGVDTAGDRSDGIPQRAVPVADVTELPDRLPLPRFGPQRESGTGRVRSGAPGRIALLVTEGDTLTDWLNAGRALQRVLLRAAHEWVFAAYSTAVLEAPDLRERLRDALDLRSHPQMLFELGQASSARTTPRRPAREVLDLVEETSRS